MFFPQIGHEPVFVDDQEDGVSASCLLACVCERVHLCLLCLFLHSLSRPRSLNKRRAVRANGIFLCVFCVPLSPDCAFFSSQFALSLFSLFFLVVVCILFFFWVFLFVVCDSAAECLTSTLEAEVRVVVVTVTHFHLFAF